MRCAQQFLDTVNQKKREAEEAKEQEKKEKNKVQLQLQPEHLRMWSLSPFAATNARPDKCSLFRPTPAYAHRMADLTQEYLKEVPKIKSARTLLA